MLLSDTENDIIQFKCYYDLHFIFHFGFLLQHYMMGETVGNSPKGYQPGTNL